MINLGVKSVKIISSETDSTVCFLSQSISICGLSLSFLELVCDIIKRYWGTSSKYNQIQTFSEFRNPDEGETRSHNTARRTNQNWVSSLQLYESPIINCYNQQMTKNTQTDRLHNSKKKKYKLSVRLSSTFKPACCSESRWICVNPAHSRMSEHRLFSHTSWI